MSATATQDRARNALQPALLALACGIALWVAIFLPEARAAVQVWSESTAYGHCYLVIPIAAYLAWDRRDSIRGLVPRPALAPILLAIPLPFAWLAAERLGIMEGRQLVAVAVLQVLCLAILGWRFYRAVSGPLLYLFFLVPFGLFLTPALQAFTAQFIDVGLNLLGIPHYITDMTIEISAGTFFVAEACAGLRFLIASIAFGVFFALLNYRSPGRRIAFIAASIVVPIIANGLRALGIVVLGNILGSAQAAAADHLIYGWFFFSAVTLLLVLAGIPFRQNPAPAPALPAGIGPNDAPGRSLAASLTPFARAALPILLFAAAGPASALALATAKTPARFTAIPAITVPEGCSLAPPTQPTPDHIVADLTCAGRVWNISLQAVPARSTGATLAEARRRMLGGEEPEDAAKGPVPNTPGWQLLTSRDTGLVLASAAWVDGRPAPGGLRQRLDQARDSLLGAQFDPVLMAIAWHPAQRPTANAMAAALDELVALIHAQPDLTQALNKTTAQ